MPLRMPPLHTIHETAGASVTEFGGWEMPVEFGSIKQEHASVRDAVGKFDVSHMGEIEVTGPDAERLTQRLTTNDVAALDPGEAQYSTITNQDGIILDDTVVYRRAAEEILFIPNAGHDGEMYDRWVHHCDEWDLDATVRNATEDYGMIAVQGPDASELVTTVADDPIGRLDRFEAMDATVAGVETWAARTGYTGEDGFEFVVPWADADTVWAAFDCPPCGLGARDTLRMEAGFLLSGQDFHPTENPRTPFEANIGFVVKLGTEFIGRDALEQVDAEGPEEKFIGFTLIDRGVPRHGYPITTPSGEAIGTVTSGTMSPTLNEPIGLGYVPVEYASPDTPIRVVIRDDPKKAKIRATPFIDQ